jgi:hypothetical protein
MTERVAAVGGGILLAGVDAVYLVIVASEGEGELGSARVLFVAGSLACAALAAVAGGLLRDQARRGLLLAFATAVVLAWAWLALFSIGLLILIAAVPIAFAALRSLEVLDEATAWSIAIAAVLVGIADVTIALLFTS